MPSQASLEEGARRKSKGNSGRGNVRSEDTKQMALKMEKGAKEAKKCNSRSWKKEKNSSKISGGKNAC